MFRAAKPRAILPAFCTLVLAAQDARPPAFEVASVKRLPVDPTGHARGNIVANPGTLAMHNIRLRDCIKWAFDVKQYQIVAPGWLGSVQDLNVDRYEILGKAGAGTPVDQLRSMLQTLLAERFKLAVHRETKELPCYALMATKKALDLQPVDDDGTEGRPGGSGTVVNGIPIPMASCDGWRKIGTSTKAFGV